MLKTLLGSEQGEKAGEWKRKEGTAYLFPCSTIIFLDSQDGVLEVEFTLK